MSVFPDESHEARIEDRYSGGRESKQSVTDLLSGSERVGDNCFELHARASACAGLDGQFGEPATLRMPWATLPWPTACTGFRPYLDDGQ